MTAVDIAGFFKVYPSRCRHRGPLEGHLRQVRFSVHRFVAYLREEGRFDACDSPPFYQPLQVAYVEWMRRRQHAADGTLDLRARSIGQFLQWLGPQATATGLSELTAERVEQFFIAYAQHAGHAARRSLQAALRTFLRFTLHAGLIRERLDLAVPTLRTYKLSTVPRGLSEAQADQVLASVDRSHPAGRRDYAILQLLYSYGVRGGQVRRLRFSDIQWAQDRIRFRADKNGKDSLLPLTAEVGASLLDYLQNARPPGAWPEVFLTCRPPHHPLPASSTLSEIVRRHIRGAGLEVPCQGAHAFRHGFATRMVAQGHSLKAVADVLGHRHLSTTFLYTKVDFIALQQVAWDWPREVNS
jgi:site-specific recombinase XerD